MIHRPLYAFYILYHPLHKLTISFFLLQPIKVVIHALHMLRPVPVLIRIPGQRFYGQFKFPADFRQLPASPLDVLALHVLLLAGKFLPLPVLPVTFAVGAFLIVAPLQAVLNSLSMS